MSAEELLALPGGRALAYEHAGTFTSSTLVIFFSGSLSVGSAAHPSPVLISKGVHYIAPTLPGFGKTSPPTRGTTYAVTIVGDISALIEHLYPDASNITLYICGHSFGSVAAQTLYAAPPTVFPASRNIKQLLLISAFPPFRNDTEKGFSYTKNMTWSTYISVGPPTLFIPFRLLQHAVKFAIQPNLSSQAKAESFVRQFMFDIMGAEEKEAVEAWKKKQGYEEGQLERETAELMRRSVEKTWQGFLSHADVLHSDWDWNNRTSGETGNDHTKERKVLIVGGKDDELTPLEWEEYLVSKYPNARSKWFVGGHVAALFHMDEIWTDFLE
jgi:pimeloyl-ACP methyl ester carboxylesterase